ncbi:MAG: aminopeptidase P family protein [Ignavibacteriales bacterium]|nr:aminopeptidase P family protein [Ignavibacteriales bacterium]
MFSDKTYSLRRNALKEKIKSGIILFLGNDESPINYSGNTYPFRQDSSFLYYFGLDEPGLVGVIDVDEDKEILFGDDVSLEDTVWTGPMPKLAAKRTLIGVENSQPKRNLHDYIKRAILLKKKIHFLPQYRAENIIRLSSLIGHPNSLVNKNVSVDLIKAVVSQREIKSKEEVAEIEFAINISQQMYKIAMKKIKPGLYEREIVGLLEGIARSYGSGISFPMIFSVHGEILHNHYYGNKMKDGDMVVVDSGAESLMHYASDITRTIPVGGKFTKKQKDIYNIVLLAHNEAVANIKAGIKYKYVHLLAAKVIAKGLKELGLMKGNIDEAVEVGAHALFFPHGLGHMLGLDVHDMEGLGEDYVGYNNLIHRGKQFGLAYLRLAKELQSGFVLTVEPGIYFIPELINIWKAEKKFTNFINYNVIEKYLDFGGIRLENDVLVENDGCRILGKKIPLTVKEVEDARK